MKPTYAQIGDPVASPYVPAMPEAWYECWQRLYELEQRTLNVARHTGERSDWATWQACAERLANHEKEKRA